MILAIDPGCTASAWIELGSGFPMAHAKVSNAELLEQIRVSKAWSPSLDYLAIEMIASYGTAVGREVFETCVWIGRFQEAWEARGGTVRLVYRRDVKLYHCESARANDSNIRAALLDRYGPGKEKAVGVKAAPGPLYGIKADEWSALAVALTAEDAMRRAA